MKVNVSLCLDHEAFSADKRWSKLLHIKQRIVGTRRSSSSRYWRRNGENQGNNETMCWLSFLWQPNEGLNKSILYFIHLLLGQQPFSKIGIHKCVCVCARISNCIHLLLCAKTRVRVQKIKCHLTDNEVWKADRKYHKWADFNERVITRYDPPVYFMSFDRAHGITFNFISWAYVIWLRDRKSGQVLTIAGRRCKSHTDKGLLQNKCFISALYNALQLLSIKKNNSFYILDIFAAENKTRL